MQINLKFCFLLLLTFWCPINAVSQSIWTLYIFQLKNYPKLHFFIEDILKMLKIVHSKFKFPQSHIEGHSDITFTKNDTLSFVCISDPGNFQPLQRITSNSWSKCGNSRRNIFVTSSGLKELLWSPRKLAVAHPGSLKFGRIRRWPKGTQFVCTAH